MTRAGATPSYTFTATLPGSLQNAPTAFNMYSDKMIFKVFDVEQSPAAQGYELHSYDVVVASCVLFTTTSLQRTLEHIRQLLKPGGYVVLLEPTTSDPIRLTTMMGGLPTWWRGLDNIHKYIPTMTPGLWHSVLRNAEFGGIDTITPKIEGADSAWPFSVMASQAVDDQVRFLRQPLSSSPSSIFIDSLVILGNKSLENSRITEGLADSLVHFCGRITILPDLPTVVEAQSLDPSSTFINLVDLDTPIFKNMTNDKMGGLKRLFELARSIMWVTRDVLVGREPYHAASLAYCRSLSNEMTHISFNALDISGLHKNTSRVISEQFLRQCALEEWGQQKFTWSQEPETFLHDGKLLLPRIMPNVDRNVRLNATRRVIVKTLPVSKSSFSIIAESDTSPLCLVQDLMPPELNKDKRGALVKIEYSTLMAHRVAPDVFLFLALGKRYAAGNPVVTLSTTNSRTVVPVVAIEVDVSVNFECLAITVASEFLAASMVHTLAPGSRILVNCSGKDQLLTAALSRRAACKAVQVILVCADDAQTLDKAWIRLSANAPRHIVRRKLLPLKPTHFLDLTTHLPWEIQPMGSVGLNIARVLPLSCRRVNLSDFSQRQASLPQLFDREALLCQLQDAASSANISMSTTREEHIQDMVIGIDRIHDRTRPHHTTSIVHWSVDGEVKVEVRSIDGRNLFSQDRTYILFGLSGQVGQSLCEWMVSNGAGCVCLTSRQPNIDQRWLDSFEGTTAMVKVLVGDITDRDSLDAMLDTVRGTCPPIAGVANGANVLNDAPFSSMSTEMMNQALRPKIDGSYNLDQAFYNDDLDFFVLFSSISCVIGTAGQSNYVAANGYLNGLAKQRRRRGLAASAFDMGLLLGIGVAQAAGQSVVDSLQKYAPTPLSETDVRQAFAESILAGYADARDEDPVIIPTAVMTSGLRTITTDETGIVWHSNPIFSHLVIDAKGTEIAAEQSRSKATALPLKEQIATAATKEEAFRALKGKLRATIIVVKY